MKKYNSFQVFLLGLLLVILMVQGLMLYNVYQQKNQEEISNKEKILWLEAQIKTIKSDFYLQNIYIPESIDFAGKKIILDNVVLEELFTKVVRLKSESWRWPIINYRLNKYSFALDTLRALGASKDLIYLAIQESFLNHQAVSLAKASGFWQFMPATGRIYKLKINDYIDERFDLAKATIAAIKHLNNLLKVFNGDWALSAAAYNAGETRVLQSIRIKGTDNYFDLNLPRETAEYFINILAWKIIIESDDNFIKRFLSPVNFSIASIEVRLTLQKRLKIKEIISVFNNSYRIWRALNPLYIRDEVPQGTHLIKIPKDNLALFNQLIERQQATYMVIKKKYLNVNLGG